MHPPARHSLRVGQRFQVALGAAAALAAISLSPGSAQALVVTVGGTQYDVTTFTGSYNSDTNKFETAANGGVMPWWGSDSLAEAFASHVGIAMGLPNYSNTHGPLFAWRFRLQDAIDNCYYISGTTGCGIANSSNTHVYAQATPYAAPSTPPVPGPLPLFGAAAAFGFSRKLRKRIKLAPAALGSSRPQA
jgi:hypothetical protein